MKRKSDPKLIWTSGELIIENSCKTIERDLSFVEKTIVETGVGNKVQKETRPLFRVIEENPRTVVTFQGFFERVQQLCQKEGMNVTVEDRRLPFPGPKLRLTKGHRFGQYDLLARGLVQNKSGLFKAPTRYGKLYIMINVLRAFPGVKTVVAAPGVDLMGQQVATMQQELPGREVRGLFSGSKDKTQSEDITVVSFDSMDKVDYDSTRLVLVDEPHAAVSAERLVSMSKFKKARIYGFGATLEGRFDGRDDLIVGLIGPVLVERTFRQAVAEKAICNIVVYVVVVKFHDFTPFNRLIAYRHLLMRNASVMEMAGYVCNQMIPPDWQTLIFISEVKQADAVQQHIQGAEIAVAARLKTAERKAMFTRMVDGKVKRCLATNIYSQGVTFPELRCMVNLSMGGGSITGIQKPGRLAQIRPGKKAGYLIDFVFQDIAPPTSGGVLWDDAGDPIDTSGPRKHWRSVVGDGQKRIKVYEDLGYEVRYVQSLDEIKIE